MSNEQLFHLDESLIHSSSNLDRLTVARFKPPIYVKEKRLKPVLHPAMPDLIIVGFQIRERN